MVQVDVFFSKTKRATHSIFRLAAVAMGSTEVDLVVELYDSKNTSLKDNRAAFVLWNKFALCVPGHCDVVLILGGRTLNYNALLTAQLCFGGFGPS